MKRSLLFIAGLMGLSACQHGPCEPCEENPLTRTIDDEKTVEVDALELEGPRLGPPTGTALREVTFRPSVNGILFDSCVKNSAGVVHCDQKLTITNDRGQTFSGPGRAWAVRFVCRDLGYWDGVRMRYHTGHSPIGRRWIMKTGARNTDRASRTYPHDGAFIITSLTCHKAVRVDD